MKKEANRFELKIAISDTGIVKMDVIGQTTQTDRAFLVTQLEMAKSIFLTDYIKNSSFKEN